MWGSLIFHFIPPFHNTLLKGSVRHKYIVGSRYSDWIFKRPETLFFKIKCFIMKPQALREIKTIQIYSSCNSIWTRHLSAVLLLLKRRITHLLVQISWSLSSIISHPIQYNHYAEQEFYFMLKRYHDFWIIISDYWRLILECFDPFRVPVGIVMMWCMDENVSKQREELYIIQKFSLKARFPWIGCDRKEWNRGSFNIEDSPSSL